MWTVVNIVERFSDRYEFHILTRNYDSPGDTTPYTSVKSNEWNDLDRTRIFYASKERLSTTSVAAIVNEVSPDCVFLNSVFGTPCIKFLIARRLKKFQNIPVVISPTGNLGTGGMTHKWLKKKTFLAIAKRTGLYNGVIWKPSTDLEFSEVKTVFGIEIRGMIAPDLTPKLLIPNYSFDKKPPKKRGSVRIIFISRIVRKKNLDFLLDCLKEISEGSVIFDIVGPQEDITYWKECLDKIATLPENISVNIFGGVDYQKGLDMLINSHFFILPTKNENFGYVFIESLAAGTPIVISDQTVWGNVEKEKAGWVIPLDNKLRWIETIQKCIAIDGSEYSEMAESSRRYAEDWLSDKTLESSTAKVFEKALEEKINK